MKRNLILLLSLSAASFGKITFQESFEGPNPKFETFETPTTIIREAFGSKAAATGLSRPGYYRFKVPFAQSDRLSLAFALTEAADKKEKTFPRSLTFLSASSYGKLKNSYQQTGLFSFKIDQKTATSPKRLFCLFIGGDRSKISPPPQKRRRGCL